MTPILKKDFPELSSSKSSNDFTMDNLFEKDNAPIDTSAEQKFTGTQIFLISMLGLVTIGFSYFLWRLDLNSEYYIAIIWIVSVLFALWWGNIKISKIISKYFSWEGYAQRRFFLQLFAGVLYSLLCINLTYYVLKINFTPYPPDINQFLTLNFYGMFLAIPVLSIHFGIYFISRWKKEFQRAEELKQAQLKSQFESLKNHLDPHFLFNNLNILSSLIHRDNQDAQEFLESFSEVYRYVLQTKKDEIIQLKEELIFADHYTLMLQKRFNWCINFDFKISKEAEDSKYIPPMTLQTLIENIVKHNIISQEKALFVDIYEDGTCLVIKNNIQEKPLGSRPTSNRIGLESIKKRYAFLTDQPVEIFKTDEQFIVKIPLLKPSF